MSAQRIQAPLSEGLSDGAGGETVGVTVRLFAMLRERAGPTIELELEPGARVCDALGALSAHEPLRGVLERLAVAVAVNHQYVKRTTELHDGDELALIPPLSGG